MVFIDRFSFSDILMLSHYIIFIIITCHCHYIINILYLYLFHISYLHYAFLMLDYISLLFILIDIDRLLFMLSNIEIILSFSLLFIWPLIFIIIMSLFTTYYFSHYLYYFHWYIIFHYDADTLLHYSSPRMASMNGNGLSFQTYIIFLIYTHTWYISLFIYFHLCFIFIDY